MYACKIRRGLRPKCVANQRCHVAIRLSAMRFIQYVYVSLDVRCSAWRRPIFSAPAPARIHATTITTASAANSPWYVCTIPNACCITDTWVVTAAPPPMSVHKVDTAITGASGQLLCVCDAPTKPSPCPSTIKAMLNNDNVVIVPNMIVSMLIKKPVRFI